MHYAFNLSFHVIENVVKYFRGRSVFHNNGFSLWLFDALFRVVHTSTIENSDCSEGFFKVLHFLFFVCGPGAPADNVALGRFFDPYENHSGA